MRRAERRAEAADIEPALGQGEQGGFAACGFSASPDSEGEPAGGFGAISRASARRTFEKASAKKDVGAARRERETIGREEKAVAAQKAKKKARGGGLSIELPAITMGPAGPAGLLRPVKGDKLAAFAALRLGLAAKFTPSA